MTTYAVTGATGHLGNLAVHALLELVTPQEIVALVRDPQKASDLTDLGVDVRAADYTNKMSLVEALTGVDKVLLVSSNATGEDRFTQHKNVVDVAKDLGLKRIAYTSILKADTSTNILAPDHKKTEEYIQASGLTYTFLRHSWYTENYIEASKAGIEYGSITTSAAGGIISSAMRADYAFADAVALVKDEGNQIYEMGGDQSWTFDELAAVLTTISGKEVTINHVDHKAHMAFLESQGLDHDTAHFVASLDTTAADDTLHDESKTISQLIGRPTVGLEEGLRQLL